jgi:hypothetical protein
LPQNNGTVLIDADDVADFLPILMPTKAIGSQSGLHVLGAPHGSRYGPAAVANAYRSLGEAASREGKVLAARAGAGQACASLAIRWMNPPMTRGPIRSGKSHYCAISTKGRLVAKPKRFGLNSGKCPIAQSTDQSRSRLSKQNLRVDEWSVCRG